MESAEKLLSNRAVGIKAKMCLYEGVIVPTVLYGAEPWAMSSAQRRKVNILEMKCLRSLVGVSRMDIFKNEEVRRRAGIERVLASRADQRIEMVWESKWRERVRGRPRLGWMDGVKVALGNRGMTVEAAQQCEKVYFHKT